jgi:S-adenosylmethionine-diacylglycerol 3-amino-3-carboxypropyl transferase
MNRFLQKINYSSSNEDSRSELRALQIEPDDSVLCITGSGARPLDLLIRKPASLVSIDFNPAQNLLLELKMKAIEALDYEEFLQFIGICPSQKRRRTYSLLRRSLAPEPRAFWDSHLRMLDKGVIYQGGWEKYFNGLSRIVCLSRPGLVKKLFNCESVREQARIWNDGWNDWEWRTFLHVISSRFVWKYFFRDPGFYRYVPRSFSIPAYNRERFDLALTTVLVRKSPYAHLLFLGKYNPRGCLPLHLRRENYPVIKNNIKAVRIVNGSLGDYLESCRLGSFNKFSLSDFSSYTGWAEYRRIWKGVIESAADGATVCERQFLVKREIPKSLSGFVRRDFDLEEELSKNDDSFFFTFIVAGVKGGGNE